MDFLKEMKEATALGLTKEEFIPIYMQDLQLRLSSLSDNGSNSASGENDARKEDELNTRSHRLSGMQQQSVSSSTDQAVVDAVKVSHAKFSEAVKTLKEDNQLTREQVSNSQQELYFVLKEILSNIQSLQQKKNELKSADSSYEESDGKTFGSAQLLKELEDTKQFVKLKIDESQSKISQEVQQYSHVHSTQNLLQTQRQEQVFQQQAAGLQAQQQQTNLLTQTMEQRLGILQAVITKQFGDIWATLHLNSKGEETRQQHMLQVVSNLATFSSFKTMFDKLFGIVDEIKIDQFSQNQLVLEELSNLQWSLQPYPDFADVEETSSIKEDAYTPIQQGSRGYKEETLVGIDDLKNEEADSSTLSYSLRVQNIRLFLRSDKEVKYVQYCPVLDSCFRASVFFPGVSGQENVIDVTLDMCQAGNDVGMPDFFRIATEISLTDLTENQYDWIVGREKGMFNIPKLFRHGWFEAASVSLDINELERYGFVYEDSICVNFNISVLEEVGERIEKKDKSLHDEDEFFDANGVPEEENVDEKQFQNSGERLKDLEQGEGEQVQAERHNKQSEEGGEMDKRRNDGEPDQEKAEEHPDKQMEKLERQTEHKNKHLGKAQGDGEKHKEEQQTEGVGEKQAVKQEDEGKSQGLGKPDNKGDEEMEERKDDHEEGEQKEKQEENQEKENGGECPPEEIEVLDLAVPHSSYVLHVSNLETLIESKTIIDGPDWYVQFLGHSIRAVLAFADDAVVICLDFFHGFCDDNLPEIAFFKCQVHLMDLTDLMDDQKVGEAVEMFDLTREISQEWTDNCVCYVPYEDLRRDRFVANNGIMLKFEFDDLQ